MQLKRWITAIIGCPILIYLIWSGKGWPFYTLLCAAAIVGLFEFYNMTSPGVPRFVIWANLAITVFIFFVFGWRKPLIDPVILISLWAIVPMAYYMLFHPAPDPRRTGDLGRLILGPVYICLPLAMLIMIDMRPNGKLWILFLLTVIFANDTGAFYFGRIFGRHKLYEAVSPKKTWEGSFGGVLTSLAAAAVFLVVFGFHKVDFSILILVLFLAAAAQIGDLAESYLKRNHNIKDSGTILPGHGGMLDRIDALLFSIPVLYLFLNWGMG
jgi:phosphatidate cytidylyltransferase